MSKEAIPSEVQDENPPEAPPPEAKNAVAKIQPSPIQAEESGTLVGRTFEDQYRIARAYHASGLMPAGLNTPEKVLVALQICHELGLPPMTSVGNIAVINGTPSLFGNLPLALVQKSGKLKNFRESFIEKDDQVIGATCMVQRNFQEEITRVFTLEDAKVAGLLGKGPWKQYPKRMLQFRARTWALKDAFPDILAGIGIEEYDQRSSSAAHELNKEFLNGE